MNYSRSQSVSLVSTKYVVPFQEQLEAEAAMYWKFVKQHASRLHVTDFLTAVLFVKEILQGVPDTDFKVSPIKNNVNMNSLL